jgi:putative membrane protein insertion efficiency factor
MSTTKCASSRSLNCLLGVWLVWLSLTISQTHAACHTCHAILPASAGRITRKVPHGLGLVAASRLIGKRPIMVAGVLVAHKVWGSRIQALWSEKVDSSVDDNEDADETDGVDSPKDPETKTSDQGGMSTAMVASIGFYKNFISPMLPPACRFLPTCSQYGVQAIQEFGPCRGGILTGWRLLRCSPVGGKGYDPPKWPPVSYTYSSY